MCIFCNRKWFFIKFNIYIYDLQKFEFKFKFDIFYLLKKLKFENISCVRESFKFWSDTCCLGYQIYLWTNDVLEGVVAQWLPSIDGKSWFLCATLHWHKLCKNASWKYAQLTSAALGLGILDSLTYVFIVTGK